MLYIFQFFRNTPTILNDILLCLLVCESSSSGPEEQHIQKEGKLQYNAEIKIRVHAGKSNKPQQDVFEQLGIFPQVIKSLTT